MQSIQSDIGKLENELDCVRATHPDEYEIFTKEFQEEKQLKQLLIEKQKVEERISKLEKFNNKIGGELEKLEKE